jgi:hypothetical protein
MRKIINDNETKSMRIKLKTARMLDSFGKKSYDESIMFLWKKVCSKKESFALWQKESGCKTPAELRQLLDKLYQENNKLRDDKK